MAKRKPTTRKTEHSVNYYDVDANNGDCRETDDFREFESKIEKVLTGKPQTIREIRLKAKTDNYYWLSMALDSLIVNRQAAVIRGYVDRYTKGDGETRTLKKVEKSEYSYNFLGA